MLHVLYYIYTIYLDIDIIIDMRYTIILMRKYAIFIILYNAICDTMLYSY